MYKSPANDQIRAEFIQAESKRLQYEFHKLMNSILNCNYSSSGSSSSN
jgi:hypothetical protein